MQHKKLLILCGGREDIGGKKLRVNREEQLSREDTYYEIRVALIPNHGLVLPVTLFIYSLRPQSVRPQARCAQWWSIIGLTTDSGCTQSILYVKPCSSPGSRCTLLHAHIHNHSSRTTDYWFLLTRYKYVTCLMRQRKTSYTMYRAEF